MKLVVCVDERNGMAFYGRRLSRDKLLVLEILMSAGENTIWINKYSKNLFMADGKLPANVKVFDGIPDGDENDLVFIETLSPADFESVVDTIVIYNWNRAYPSNLKFEMLPGKWEVNFEEEFAGSSHEKITKTVYVKEA